MFITKLNKVLKVGTPRHKKRLKNKVAKDTRTIFSTSDLILARGWLGAFKYVYVESFPNRGFLKKSGLLGLFYVFFYFMWPFILLVSVPHTFMPAPSHAELNSDEGVLQEYKYSTTWNRRGPSSKDQDIIVISSNGLTKSYGGSLSTSAIKTVKASIGTIISVKWHEPGTLFVLGRGKQFVELSINGKKIDEYDYNYRIKCKRYLVIIHLVSYLFLFGIGYRRWKKVDRYLGTLKQT